MFQQTILCQDRQPGQERQVRQHLQDLQDHLKIDISVRCFKKYILKVHVPGIVTPDAGIPGSPAGPSGPGGPWGPGKSQVLINKKLDTSISA